MRIVVLCKRQYTNRDVIDDRYGRLWEIPAALARQGHTVTAIVLSYRTRPALDADLQEATPGQVRWLSVNLGSLAIPGFFKYFRLVRDVIRAERPDVIWSCSDTIYTILGEYFATRNECAVISDLYDNFEYFGSYRVPVIRSQFRRAVRESDGVSCVSNALRGHLLSQYDRTKSTVVVTNAVDTAAFKKMDKATCREKLGLPIDGVLVGAAGDISNYRGADTLYQAFSGSSDELKGAQLVVAGFRDRDTEVPPQENVIDLGQIAPTDIPFLLNSLDLVVVYNRSSTFGDYCFPQKFYEAVACDRPVVVAKVGELAGLLKAQPDLFYQDGDRSDLVAAISRQLDKRLRAGVTVPTWQVQAALLSDLMESVQCKPGP